MTGTSALNHRAECSKSSVFTTGMSKAPKTPTILPKQPVREVTLREYKEPTPKKEIELMIPPFLQEAGKKCEREKINDYKIVSWRFYEE